MDIGKIIADFGSLVPARMRPTKLADARTAAGESSAYSYRSVGV
jgi:hypothetical protein